MQAFTRLTGVAVPIDLPNVDTDRIIPARFLRRERDEPEYATFLFHDVRFNADGLEMEIETGRLAKLADGAVVVRVGGTTILSTVCTSKPREGIDFFPLTVEVEERMYAAGKIPGSFFRREGRPLVQYRRVEYRHPTSFGLTATLLDLTALRDGRQ